LGVKSVFCVRLEKIAVRIKKSTMLGVFLFGICFVAEGIKIARAFDIVDIVKARAWKVATTKDGPEDLVPDEKNDSGRSSFSDIVKAGLWRAVASKL